MGRSVHLDVQFWRDLLSALGGHGEDGQPGRFNTFHFRSQVFWLWTERWFLFENKTNIKHPSITKLTVPKMQSY